MNAGNTAGVRQMGFWFSLWLDSSSIGIIWRSHVGIRNLVVVNVMNSLLCVIVLYRSVIGNGICCI